MYVILLLNCFFYARSGFQCLLSFQVECISDECDVPAIGPATSFNSIARLEKREFVN